MENGTALVPLAVGAGGLVYLILQVRSGKLDLTGYWRWIAAALIAALAIGMAVGLLAS